MRFCLGGLHTNRCQYTPIKARGALVPHNLAQTLDHTVVFTNLQLESSLYHLKLEWKIASWRNITSRGYMIRISVKPAIAPAAKLSMLNSARFQSGVARVARPSQRVSSGVWVSRPTHSSLRQSIIGTHEPGNQAAGAITMRCR